MREILFRGLRTDGKGWVEGDLLTGVGTYKKGLFYILPVVNNLASIPGCHPLDGLEVIPESVGQFTGLTDKNGTKIFEGDVFDGDEEGDYYTVIWNEDECRFQLDLYGYNLCTGENSQEIYSDSKECIDTNCFDISALSGDVIIGNIHKKK